MRHATDDEEKNTIDITAVLILGRTEMLHPHNISHSETGNGAHPYKVPSVCFWLLNHNDSSQKIAVTKTAMLIFYFILNGTSVSIYLKLLLFNKQKVIRIEHDPHEILNSLASVFILQELNTDLEFFTAGRSPDGGQRYFINKVSVAQRTSGERRDTPIRSLQLLFYFLGIEQMQGLRDSGITTTAAFTGGFP